MIDTFNGALLLRKKMMESLRDSPHVVRRGFLVVLLVGLLVGGVGGIQQFMGTMNPEGELAQFEALLRDSLEQQAMAAPSPEQRQVYAVVLENLGPGFDMVKRINELPTPLPRPASALLRGLGVLVSMPLEYLGGVLFAVVFTHIAARWFGGTGTIQQMLGLGALSVAPHALDAIAFIPIIGSTIGSMLSNIAWLWGLIIFIVGTSIAHNIDHARAAFAVLFFPIVGALLGGLGCCGLFFILLSIIRAA